MADCFPQFSSLPSEIRLMIWERHMSHQPTVFTDHIAVLTQRWYQQLKDYHSRGDPIYVQVPIPAAAFVNREAREVVISWAEKNNLQLRFCQETQAHVYVRKGSYPWGPVYVPPESWDWIIPLLESNELDYDDEVSDDWTHLVFPAETIYWRVDWARWLCECNGALSKVSVIWGELPKLCNSQVSPSSVDRDAVSLSDDADIMAVWRLDRFEWEDRERNPCVPMERTAAFDGEADVPRWSWFHLRDAMSEIHDKLSDHPAITVHWLFKDVMIWPVRVVRGEKKYGEPSRPKTIWDDWGW